MQALVSRAVRSRTLLATVGGASVGAGLFWARCRASPAAPACFAAHPEVAAAYPGLASAVGKICELDAAQGATLVAHTVRLAHLAATTDPSAQWQITRLNAEVLRLARHVCATAPAHESDARYRLVGACVADTLPQLETWLDNLLHNHLLLRMQ